MTHAPHEPWDERAEAELLLDAVLAEPARRSVARARLLADARGAARLRAFEVRLTRARQELRDGADWSPAREERLVERVLSATTHREVRSVEPATVRSLAPRLAAAGLLFLAGVLAFRWSRSTPELSGARSTAPPAAVPGSAAASDVAEILAQAREQLATSASARPKRSTKEAPESAEHIELRLLEARAKGLRERRWEAWLEALPLTELGLLSQALWCEVQLDRYVLTGELPPAWNRALAILERGVRSPPELEQESSKLLARALARARTYGVAAEPTVAHAEPRDELWTGEWFDQLASAGREAGLSDAGQLRAWVDWRGQ